jgi:hypothetical protein
MYSVQRRREAVFLGIWRVECLNLCRQRDNQMHQVLQNSQGKLNQNGQQVCDGVVRLEAIALSHLPDCLVLVCEYVHLHGDAQAHRDSRIDIAPSHPITI